MWTEIICLFFGVLVGIAITLGSWIGYDKRKEHRREEWFEEMKDALTNHYFCKDGCGYYENCHERFKDPEIAEDELIHNYCYVCPVKMATDLLDKYEV